LLFTAGIGENSEGVRASGCQGLEGLGVTLSPKRNRAAPAAPRADDAPVAMLVVPTNEEFEIAEQTLAVVGGLTSIHRSGRRGGTCPILCVTGRDGHGQLAAWMRSP
jgi:hypothetical protein